VKVHDNDWSDDAAPAIRAHKAALGFHLAVAGGFAVLQAALVIAIAQRLAGKKDGRDGSRQQMSVGKRKSRS
jgi:hypothetical protein